MRTHEMSRDSFTRAVRRNTASLQLRRSLLATWVDMGGVGYSQLLPTAAWRNELAYARECWSQPILFSMCLSLSL